MKTLLLACLLTLGLASVASAQAIGTSKLEFDQAATTLAEANAFAYKYYPDAASMGILLPVICTGTASPFVCSAAFPAFTPGPHALTLTASNIAGESPRSTPLSFTFVVIPAPPLNLRIR